MGKKDFKDLYRRIKNQLGIVTCEISVFSDTFNPRYRYAGVIIYAVDGKFEWQNFGKWSIIDANERIALMKCPSIFRRQQRTEKLSVTMGEVFISSSNAQIIGQKNTTSRSDKEQYMTIY